jgi:hypothetical protein
MDRREFILQAIGAYGLAGLISAGDGASDLRDVYVTIDGETWHVVGQVSLGEVDKELFERVDEIRQKLQSDLRLDRCAILWDGPPESVIGSCSPQLDTWPERLKAKLPFPITIGRCVNC